MPASRTRQRERSPQQQAAAAAAREQRLEALHQQLADGVEAIRDGQAWRSWLDMAGRFHTYSFNNQLLISLQAPHATQVAGYGAWQAMGRQVRKGEKAIWILAPVTRRGPRPDSSTGIDVEELAGPTTAGDPPASAQSGRSAGRGPVVGFRGAAVFDVSSTDGDPVPTPPRPVLLAGQAPPGLWDALTEAIAARGFTVARCPTVAGIGGANGLTDFGARTVTVRADVDDAQAVRTLAHEAGHVLLHNPEDRGQGPACRGLVEVEAESVAYLVTGHHGLTADDYSFAYIAGWAGRDAAAVTSTAQRVLHAARTLIEATDPATTADPAAAAQLADAAHTGLAAAQGTAANAATTRSRLAGALDPDSERLRDLLGRAQAWFLAQAATSNVYAAGAAARGYTPEQTLDFGVGFAPATWTGLVDHLRQLGHPDSDLLAAGLASTARGGRLIDRFRGRITFPLHDQTGVVGFTARDTTGRAEAPKYLNSPASGLYDKSRLLFGTQHLPTGSTGRPTVVLAEGPWDALAVTHAGGGGSIGLAACGTAVTDAHLELAQGPDRRRPLVLAPDNDPAGITALGRTLAMLQQTGTPHPGAVRTPPDGKDLADVHATSGTTAVAQLIAGARAAGLVYAEAWLDTHPPAEWAEARIAAARAAAAHTSGLTLGQRADLGSLLIAKAGITTEAALRVVTPPAVTVPKPAAAAAPAHRGPAAAPAGLAR